MNININKTNKYAVLLLVPAILISSVTKQVKAAPPSVTTDEALYVNLDYYGVPTETSIVKGCNLNGNTEFKDFGSYSKVTNMSNRSEPILSEDGVLWNLPENNKRFYFECTPKEEIPLPWTLDVSYKLNGSDIHAEKLAGSEGLIEITVHCIPNENVGEYFKNNMILQIASVYNMTDINNIEAPGAQVQTIGNHKAVLFMALPGEDITCKIKIGTNNFETTGIVAMMVPGTLDQLKNIKDFKEAKDKIKNSSDAIHESLNKVLDVIQNMEAGIIDTKEGLAKLDEARKYINENKAEVHASADVSLEDLQKLTDELLNIIPHLQTAQNAVNDLNTDINNMTDTITSISTDIDDIKASITQLQSNTEQFQKMLKDLDDTKETRRELVSSLSKNLKDLSKNFENLKIDLGRLKKDTENLQTSIKDFRYSLNPVSISIPKDVIKPDESLEFLPEGELTEMLKLLDSAINTKLISMINGINNAFDDAGGYVNYAYDESADVIDDLVDFLDTSGTTIADIEMISSRVQEISLTLQSAMELTEKYLDIIDENYDNSDKTLEELKKIGDEAKSFLDKFNSLTGDINSLRNTLNNYKNDFIALLEYFKDLTNSLTQASTSATDFLLKLKNFISESGNYLNDGSESTLSGMLSILESSIDGINTTPTLKNANNTVKNTIDDEISKFEDENNFLNLDTEADPVSFTSPQNLSPESLQIILRTEEISLDIEDETIEDYETEEADEGVWTRIINIFKKIYAALSSIFE